MALEIVAGKNSEILDSFSFNKDAGTLTMASRKNDVKLVLELPFNISKVHDKVFESQEPISEILIFKNNYFAEKDCIELKFKDENQSKPVGFLFSLRGLLETDNIIDRKLSPYAVRALVMLLSGKAGLSPRKASYRQSQDYTFWDFYDDDLVVCAISTEQLGNYNIDFHISLMVHLGRYGFYIISNLEDNHFLSKNIFYKSSFDDLVKLDSKVIIKLLNSKITKEPYLLTYYTTLVSSNENYISKFLLIYQCFEILMDLVLRFELEEKITPEKVALKTGFQMKELVLEMSTESYRMDALFKQYTSCEYESDYHISADILSFFDTHRDNYTMRANQSHGSIFYELRNQLVHNLKFIYKGEFEAIERRKNELSEIINKMEFLLNEILIGLKL